MYLKFGFGRATQDAGIEIRRGAMTRDQAINLIRLYDGGYPNDQIKLYLDYYEMNKEEFDSVIDRWVNKELLKRKMTYGIQNLMLNETEPNVAIVDYGAGNQVSVAKAFEYLGANVSILSNPESMDRFSHIVLPGVGSFNRSINFMRELNWDQSLIEIAKQGKPLLGICLGMQLLFSIGSEDGISQGLNIIWRSKSFFF